MLSESFAVVSGRHTQQQLVGALVNTDSVVIMKAGQSRVRVLDALSQAGRLSDARYLEYIGRDNERIEVDVTRLPRVAGPYFSLFVVTPNRSDT